ncbi:MAG: lipopolysaccharide transport periplasmic protein LptA [Rubrivivax sp.]|nr:lipopolysaccharide transport periplasmic protein LptA [Rubrivivax sp.]HNE61299.1 lipopolysaccharide transport periplasmic protein LptA [Ottowia sp.]
MKSSVPPFAPRLRLLCATLLLGLAAPAWAERADRDKPMNIEADALRYEEQKQQSTFTGKVLVTKGTIVMRGARLEVRQDSAGNQFGTLSGEPGKRAFFRQKREGVNEFIEGEGETIEYDGKTDTVRLIRRAEMRRLEGATQLDQVLGSLIVYNNRTEVYTVDGAPAAGAPSAAPGGRVRATLAPRQAASAASAASAPALQLRPAAALPEGSGQ